MKFIFSFFTSFGLLFLPFISTAASPSLDSTFTYVFSILEKVSALLIPAGFLFFIFRLIRFIKDSQSGSTDLGKSKSMLIWSIITLFFMVGIWSVVAYVQKTIFQGNMQSDITELPVLPTSL